MKWINIKDQLPEKQGHYLCYCTNSFYKNYRGVIAEFYDDNKVFYGECCETPLKDVIYWAELPELPKNFIPQIITETSSENAVLLIQNVSNRRELLIAFSEWWNENYADFKDCEPEELKEFLDKCNL